MKQHDMEWGNIKEVGTGNNMDFMKLNSGINQVRVVGKPSLIDIHWEKTVEGGQKKIICPGAGCPICKAGNAPMSRYQIKVIDRADGKIKVLEGGPSIFNAIKCYAVDPDYGDPERYDLKIKKEGNGRDTRYSCVAAPKQSEYTDAEKQLIAESKSLEEINKAKTIEEISQMGLTCLFDNADSLGNDSSQKDDGFTDDDWGSL